MAGFSIMLMNFVLLPLIFLFMLLWAAFVFVLGGLAAALVIYLVRKVTGQRQRTLYIRTENASGVAELLRGAGVKERQSMVSAGPGPSLVKAHIGKKINLPELMTHIAAMAGTQGMYVE